MHNMPESLKRKSIDCRNYPSEKNCSLKISGTEDEVFDAAVQHAVSAHDTRMAQSFGIRSKRCSKTKPINCAEASVSDPVGWRDFLISPENVAAGSENSPLQSAAIVSDA